MAKKSKAKQIGTMPEFTGLVVHWTRLDLSDSSELRRREITTGVSVARQIRILIHEALMRKKVMR